MVSVESFPINCDVKTFNEIWCGGINKDNNDPSSAPERKTGWLYREHPFFFSNICEAIIIFKEYFKKK